MRGIDGINDGQQVFSYDASFKDANHEEVKSLFSYQPPTLEPGVIMTEEIAHQLPKSFIYRKLDNGMCAIALNTYLGRDYMGSAGRFGNHLSHVILADESDIKAYPCEYYGSNSLRDHMNYEEVNNPERPDYLPEPILEQGLIVDINNVVDFLGIDNHIEIYKNMLHAVLAFESERKRVVICDTPENIIMWIAAILYSLPLKTALGINFSTYDFDPSLSASQICGVLPQGSRYTAETQRLHFVFDLFQNKCAEFDKDELYFDFIDTAMSFSYDSLQDFHRFLIDGYSYNKADEKMYSAYRLYSLLSDGITGLPEKEISSALEFAKEYALPVEHIRILQNLFEQKLNLLKSDVPSFLSIMRYAIYQYKSLSYELQTVIRAQIVDKVLHEFLNNKSGESEFVSFYDEVDYVCREAGFSTATELMKASNHEKLFEVIGNDISAWKIAFLVKVICAFVKDQRVPIKDLIIDAPLGQTYYVLVKAVNSKNEQNGFFLITRILDEFSDNSNYLTNMALNIEGMLLDFPNGNEQATSMWKYFGQTMIKSQVSSFTTAYAILDNYKRYDQINMLYSLAMSSTNDLTDIQQIFNEHLTYFTTHDKNYLQQYNEKILSDYYYKLEVFDNKLSYNSKLKIFDIVSETKLEVPFAENLVNDIVKNIPFESPSRENSKLIQKIFAYLYNDIHKPVSGKLLLLIIAMVLEKCKKSSQLNEAFESLERLTDNTKADMSRFTANEAKHYFDWLLPSACAICERTSDIESLYNLFEMPNDIASIFFTSCTDIYLRKSKSAKDYVIFCEFLGCVFARENSLIRKDIGKVLSKLNKQKLSDLDKTVNNIYRDNMTAISLWNEIKEVAESTSPILNSLSNLFRRKKD